MSPSEPPRPVPEVWAGEPRPGGGRHRPTPSTPTVGASAPAGPDDAATDELPLTPQDPDPTSGVPGRSVPVPGNGRPSGTASDTVAGTAPHAAALRGATRPTAAGQTTDRETPDRETPGLTTAAREAGAAKHTADEDAAIEHTGPQSTAAAQTVDGPAPGARLPDPPARSRRGRRRTPAVPVTGHGHGHGAASPAGRRVRLLIAALLIPCALATLVGVVLLWPSGGPTPQSGAQVPVDGEVTAAQATDCTPGSGQGGCVALVIRMADGPLPGRDLVQVVPVEPGTPTFGVGDEIVLDWSGAAPTDPGSYQVVDFQRDGSLLWLTALFVAAVLLLGRWRGLASLAALALSFAVLLAFVMPAILAGRDPLAVAVVGSCLIMFVVLYLTHGPSARTSTAVLGTLASLALIGVLGALFSAAARLTGLDDQTTTLIASLGTGVDARGLLLAGVVIGALGVLDDVTVTQTSAVWELRRADPDMSAPALFASAMRIGRDHVASAVNTLVLAYAGASLPLLLLFTLSGQQLAEVATSQSVATEIVRTLVGSIGLVASVPITTALAAVVASRETPKALGR